jgi:O-methyltransferase domain
VGGDFFSSVLPDGDVYVLKSVVHNWDDEAVGQTYRFCSKARGRCSILMTKALEFSHPRCLPVRCNLVSTAIQFPGLSFPCKGWREKKLTNRSAAPFGFVCSMA